MNIFGYTITKDLQLVKRPKIDYTEEPVNRANNYKEDPAGFMVSVIKAQHTLYKKEIAHWQLARQEAFNIYRPRRRMIIEIYNEMMQTDAIVISETNKRRDRILNKKFKIIDFNSKKENQDKTDLFNKKWFFDWMGHVHDYLYYGHSLPYIKSIVDGRIKDIDIVDRKHVVPEMEGFLQDLFGEKIYKYTEKPFTDYCTPIGKKEWLGLLDAAVPLYILRKHSWANWDQFEEMFGIPLRIAKTTSTDPKVRNAMNSWLKDLGSAGRAVFPADTELEIIESKQADAFEVFNQKRKAANEELALLINAQYETSNNSGSRAKAEVVVESTQDQTTLSDLRMLYFEINDNLMSILAKLGYPINPEMDVFQWDNPEDLQEKLTIFKGVADMGFELDKTQVEDVFNVKILGKKEIVNPFQTPFKQEDEEPKK